MFAADDSARPNAPRKTVLVLDDEPEMRKLVSIILTNYGYSVLLASDGEDAIRIFQKNRERVDLLLLDVVSPGLCGPMVAREEPLEDFGDLVFVVDDQ